MLYKQKFAGHFLDTSLPSCITAEHQKHHRHENGSSVHTFGLVMTQYTLSVTEPNTRHVSDLSVASSKGRLKIIASNDNCYKASKTSVLCELSAFALNHSLRKTVVFTQLHAVKHCALWHQSSTAE